MPLRANYSFSKIAGEAVCTWVAEQFNIPLTIIRICSTYGPEGGTPADRLEMMLQGKPIRLYPDKPNNYNPIYEDDYVELGIRAMEVAAVPPIVVNWAGSETVSVEDYCAYMGELVGVEPIFEYTPEAHTPLWPDVTYMHEVLGRTKVHWRDGFRKMIEARHPELLRAQTSKQNGKRRMTRLSARCSIAPAASKPSRAEATKSVRLQPSANHPVRRASSRQISTPLERHERLERRRRGAADFAASPSAARVAVAAAAPSRSDRRRENSRSPAFRCCPGKPGTG